MFLWLPSLVDVPLLAYHQNILLNLHNIQTHPRLRYSLVKCVSHCLPYSSLPLSVSFYNGTYIFRAVLLILIITIFTKSDYLRGIFSHRNNFPDDFETLRKFISWCTKFTRHPISIIILKDDPVDARTPLDHDGREGYFYSSNWNLYLSLWYIIVVLLHTAKIYH